MRIGILAAMGKEIELLLPLIENRSDLLIDASGVPTDNPGLHGVANIHRGKISDNEVCLMQCGIGKVNSALNTRRLIEYFNPELIINSGVAGGADGSMHVEDLLIARQTAYHDVWCGPGTEYGAADGLPQRMECDRRIINAALDLFADNPRVRFGLICSGDKFISTRTEVDEIKKNFPDALACDMESASIAQVSSMAKIPFAIIRVVSDTPGEAENISQYVNFWSDAPKKTFSAISSILRYL